MKTETYRCQQNYQFEMLQIQVQCCVDCHLHNWCSRHNQAKYHEFYDRLEAKARAVLKNFTIIKNQVPENYEQRQNISGLGVDSHRYIDEKNQIVIFPRHGAFEVKVNGMLIFSKLQSNLWPNTEKIGYLLTQISNQLETGNDIQKYSLQYRLQNENEDQYFVDTYKKVIKFKIFKRPFSSQFNASAYAGKASVENSSDKKIPAFKRRNVVSLKKASKQKLDISRKTDYQKRPIPRLKGKIEKIHHQYHNNEFKDFQEGDNFIEEHYQMPDMGKINKSQKYSPRTRKRFHMKNELGPLLKPLPLDVPTTTATNQIKRLEKKPSRKLVIKANDKKSSDSFKKINQYQQKVTDVIGQSQSILVNASETPVIKQQVKIQQNFIEQEHIQHNSIQQQQKIKKKSVKNIQAEHEILVQKYEEKTVENNLPKKQITIQKKDLQSIVSSRKASEPKMKSQKHQQQSSNGGYQNLMEELDKQQKEEQVQSHHENKTKTQRSQLSTKKVEEEINKKGEQLKSHKEQIKQTNTIQKIAHEPVKQVSSIPLAENISKKKSQKSKSDHQLYDEQYYDEYQEQQKNGRPETSNYSRRGEKEAPEQQQILQHQEQKNQDFKKKIGNIQKVETKQEVLYEEEYEQFPQEQNNQDNQIPIIINRQKDKNNIDSSKEVKATITPDNSKKKISQYQQNYEEVEENQKVQEVNQVKQEKIKSHPPNHQEKRQDQLIQSKKESNKGVNQPKPQQVKRISIKGVKSTKSIGKIGKIEKQEINLEHSNKKDGEKRKKTIEIHQQSLQSNKKKQESHVPIHVQTKGDSNFEIKKENIGKISDKQISSIQIENKQKEAGTIQNYQEEEQQAIKPLPLHSTIQKDKGTVKPIEVKQQITVPIHINQQTHLPSEHTPIHHQNEKNHLPSEHTIQKEEEHHLPSEHTIHKEEEHHLPIENTVVHKDKEHHLPSENTVAHTDEKTHLPNEHTVVHKNEETHLPSQHTPIHENEETHLPSQHTPIDQNEKTHLPSQHTPLHKDEEAHQLTKKEEIKYAAVYQNVADPIQQLEAANENQKEQKVSASIKVHQQVQNYKEQIQPTQQIEIPIEKNEDIIQHQKNENAIDKTEVLQQIIPIQKKEETIEKIEVYQQVVIPIEDNQQETIQKNEEAIEIIKINQQDSIPFQKNEQNIVATDSHKEVQARVQENEEIIEKTEIHQQVVIAIEAKQEDVIPIQKNHEVMGAIEINQEVQNVINKNEQVILPIEKEEKIQSIGTHKQVIEEIQKKQQMINSNKNHEGIELIQNHANNHEVIEVSQESPIETTHKQEDVVAIQNSEKIIKSLDGHQQILKNKEVVQPIEVKEQVIIPIHQHEEIHLPSQHTHLPSQHTPIHKDEVPHLLTNKKEEIEHIVAHQKAAEPIQQVQVANQHQKQKNTATVKIHQSTQKNNEQINQTEAQKQIEIQKSNKDILISKQEQVAEVVEPTKTLQQVAVSIEKKEELIEIEKPEIHQQVAIKIDKKEELIQKPHIHQQVIIPIEKKEQIIEPAKVLQQELIPVEKKEQIIQIQKNEEIIEKSQVHHQNLISTEKKEEANEKIQDHQQIIIPVSKKQNIIPIQHNGNIIEKTEVNQQMSTPIKKNETQPISNNEEKIKITEAHQQIAIPISKNEEVIEVNKKDEDIADVKVSQQVIPLNQKKEQTKTLILKDKEIAHQAEIKQSSMHSIDKNEQIKPTNVKEQIISSIAASNAQPIHTIEKHEKVIQPISSGKVQKTVNHVSPHDLTIPAHPKIEPLSQNHEKLPFQHEKIPASQQIHSLQFPSISKIPAPIVAQVKNELQNLYNGVKQKVETNSPSLPKQSEHVSQQQSH